MKSLINEKIDQTKNSSFNTGCCSASTSSICKRRHNEKRRRKSDNKKKENGKDKRHNEHPEDWEDRKIKIPNNKRRQVYRTMEK